MCSLHQIRLWACTIDRIGSGQSDTRQGCVHYKMERIYIVYTHEFECNLGNNCMSYVIRNYMRQSREHFIFLIHNECNYFPKLHKNLCNYMLIILYGGTSLIRLPEMRTSTMMQTLCLVWNAPPLTYIQSEPLTWYSVKRTLDIAPTVSLPLQTHLHSGHFASRFTGSMNN